MAVRSELEPIRMGQLREGDTLVRFRPPIGNLRVTSLVRLPGGHLDVHYLREEDGSPDKYPTWTSTHAYRRAVPPVDTSSLLWKG